MTKDKLNNKADEIWKSAIKLSGKFFTFAGVFHLQIYCGILSKKGIGGKNTANAKQEEKCKTLLELVVSFGHF